jgi:glyoxylate/hydroxypyruvate reductase A
MSIAIIFNQKDPKYWAETLQALLPETLIEIYPNIKDKDTVDFVLCWKPNQDVLAEFPNIKVMQSVGAAVDHIINTQNIHNDQTVCRIVDEALSNDMFEFLLTIVLTQLKNIPLYIKQKEQKLWEPKAYKNIKDLTISIMGLGNIGAEVAEKMASIGFKVKGWSASKKDIKRVHSFVGDSELANFLKGTDVLINILPVTQQTRGIINKKFLMQINKGGFFINVGRGNHVIETDLVEMLNSDQLSGALLDVFDIEPLPINHPFWGHPKIQITPHIASVTHIQSAALLVVENYKNHLTGLPVKHIASLKKGY